MIADFALAEGLGVQHLGCLVAQALHINLGRQVAVELAQEVDQSLIQHLGRILAGFR